MEIRSSVRYKYRLSMGIMRSYICMVALIDLETICMVAELETWRYLAWYVIN